MSAVPLESEYTVCETGCKFVHHSTHERRAPVQLAGLALPTVRLPELDQPEGGQQCANGAGEPEVRQGLARKLGHWLWRRWLGYGDDALSSEQQAGPSRPLAWHTSKLQLAVGSGPRQVLVFRVERGAGGGAGPAAVDKPQRVLQGPQQQQVSALAWRPMYSSMLAVGCTGGVCLWSLGTGAQPGSDSPSEGSPPMAFLPFSSSTAAVSSLAWSPDGRLLVGSSHQWPGLVVWDVASGRAEPMRAVTAALQLLRYSPCGNYLFAAGMGSSYYLIETRTWGWQRWTGAGGVRSVHWSPSGRTLLLALRGSQELITLCAVGAPPSLDWTLMPVSLPEPPLPEWLVQRAQSQAGGPGAYEADGAAASSSAQPEVGDVAWSPGGQRLVVALCKPHAAAGLLVVYDTRPIDQILTAHFAGFARPAGAGDGEGLQLSFAPCFPQGALLSVQLNGGQEIVNIPFFLRHK